MTNVANNQTHLKQFAVTRISANRFVVWNVSTTEDIAFYDNRKDAEAHAVEAQNSYVAEMTNVVRQQLNTEHAQLMQDIEFCVDMIDPDDWDESFRDNLIEAAELMSQRLDTLETIMFLKQTPDCDCYYLPN